MTVINKNKKRKISNISSYRPRVFIRNIRIIRDKVFGKNRNIALLG